MAKLENLLVAGSSYEISLRKLAGFSVKDVRGYLSTEFGDVSFKLTSLVLENGCVIRIEGEHDHPYLTPAKDAPASLQSDALQALHDESEG